MLFCVEHKAARDGSGHEGLVLQLEREHVLDAVTVPVTFILCHGQTNVDVQPAVRRGRVVGFRHGLPLNAVRFQNFLYLVIVADIPEPAIQLREQDHVEVMPPDAVKEPDEFLPVRVFLPGGQCFVDERVDQDTVIPGDEVVQYFVLRFQRVAVKNLIVVAAPDVFDDADAVQFRG